MDLISFTVRVWCPDSPRTNGEEWRKWLAFADAPIDFTGCEQWEADLYRKENPNQPIIMPNGEEWR